MQLMFGSTARRLVYVSGSLCLATWIAIAGLTGGSGGCASSTVSVGDGNGGAAAGGGKTPGGGGTNGLTIDTTAKPIASDAAVVNRTFSCDGGDACSCPPLNVAVIGKPGKWGAARTLGSGTDSDTALQDWLNSSSAGTARADNFTNRVTLTADFLATYNVIILASLSDDSENGPFWTYGDDEAAAFRAWIENGGGVVSMISYSGSPDEVRPVNQLIGFSGVNYSSDGNWGACADWAVCNCNGSQTVSDWIRTDAVIANLSTGVTYVGWANGRPITAPTDAHVAATMGGKPALVGKLVGKGRVLAYGDEWISYTSQWTGANNPKASEPSCQGNMAQDKYQVAQFWYNMIRWSQPSSDCFTIVSTPETPITIW